MSKIKILDKTIDVSKSSDLTSLGVSNYCDKAWHHKYTDFYEQLFEEFGYSRESEISILELGVSRGGSAFTLIEWFKNIKYCGYDVNNIPFYLNGGDETRTIEGPPEKEKNDLFEKYNKVKDKENVKFLSGIGRQAESKVYDIIREECKDSKLDVIIDDCSHKLYETVKSFNELFPLLKSKGIYIVEDSSSLFLADLENQFRNWGETNKFIDKSYLWSKKHEYDTLKEKIDSIKLLHENEILFAEVVNMHKLGLPGGDFLSRGGSRVIVIIKK